jgi:hypothetical protein
VSPKARACARRKNLGLVNGLSQSDARKVAYFFFFAAVFFFAGAFFLAFDFAAFLFIGMFASLLRSVACFEPLSSQALPQQPPTIHTGRIIWMGVRAVNSRMPFWKFFFKVGIPASDEEILCLKMLLPAHSRTT